MKMPESTITTIPQFLSGIADYPNLAWIYRGQGDASWPLIPKAGRPKYYLRETGKPALAGLPPRDFGRFNHWRNLAVAYTKSMPENDYECLAFAQHYGLATRLLDWSTNPLVALYFAVDSQTDADAAIFCYTPQWHIDTATASLGERLDVGQITPPPIDSRILVQSGVFTYHPAPNEPLLPGEIIHDLGLLRPTHGIDLVRFLVPSKIKPILKRQLSEIGVNRKAVFPDLEGLSEFVNWETSRAASTKSEPD
ncbi:FRG domain-containing protein [Stratiformator vulcanicus]|uniref:FRG domain protein n=1 Tax=Stratiformator vulcanicus TaxID=2527980 RepID=A0A517R249_9PLAN|nr:FRG domain-containing protein [Stratiformator vulcanicus]QDT37956.1 FRG domain protein [Stratiformator vulcanicus]